MLGVDIGSLQGVPFVFTLVRLAYRLLFVEHPKANWQPCKNGIYIWKRQILGVPVFKHQAQIIGFHPAPRIGHERATNAAEVSHIQV